MTTGLGVKLSAFASDPQLLFLYPPTLGFSFEASQGIVRIK